MPYTPTSWVSGTTPVDAPEMNNVETQYTEAINSFGPDVFSAGWVLTGAVATKDGTIASQLDVTAATAYLKQTDGSFRQRKPSSTNFATAVASTTYYLFLKNDGTYQWSTTSTGPTNSIAIAQATTDGSANILAVTDVRPLNPDLFSGIVGALNLPDLTTDVKLKSGMFYWSGAFGGADQDVFRALATDGTKDWRLRYNHTDSSLAFVDVTDTKTPIQMKTDGSVALGGALAGVSATFSSTLAVTGALTHAGSTVWDAGNDGSGSGLDADLLDGHDSAFFLAASSYTASDVLTKIKTVDGAGSGLDADLLDGNNASAFPKVGTHNLVTFTLSAGTTAPTTLDTNEIYFQLG